MTFPLLDVKKPHVVKVLTNFRSFDIRLDVADSPCTTSSFAALVRRRFFDGTVVAWLGVVTKGLKVVERVGRLGNPATERPTKRVVVLRRAVAS